MALLALLFTVQVKLLVISTIIPFVPPPSVPCHDRSRWFVISTIIGATSMEQLRSNLATFTRGPGGASGVQLGQEVLDAIEEVHNEMRNPALQD